MDAVTPTGSESDQSILQKSLAEILALISEDPVTTERRMGEINPRIIWWKRTIHRLEGLPLEILTLIFKGLGPLYYSRPLLDSLISFVPPNLFKKLELSYPQLLKLCSLLRPFPRLINMVLELRCDWAENGVDYEQGDEKVLFDFFATATSLKSLTIGNYPRLRSRLLSVKFVLSRYPTLDRLDVRYDSLNPEKLSHQYRFLSLFPRLKHLAVSYDSTNAGVTDDPVFTEDERTKFDLEDVSATEGAEKRVFYETSLESLTLVAKSFDAEGVVEFVRKFPGLTSLQVSVELSDGQVDLTNLLAAVNPNLLRLHVYGSHDDDEWPEADVPDTLIVEMYLDFPKLTSLHLYNDDCSILALRKLINLTSLSFRNAPDYPTLHQLLVGSTRLSSLRKLAVNIPEGRRGISHLDEGYYLEDHYEGGEVQIGPGWLAASHREGSGVRELLDAARRAHVTLGGSWWEAFETAEAHEREIEWCRTFQLHENYHLLRDQSCAPFARIGTEEAEYEECEEDGFDEQEYAGRRSAVDGGESDGEEERDWRIGFDEDDDEEGGCEAETERGIIHEKSTELYRRLIEGEALGEFRAEFLSYF